MTKSSMYRIYKGSEEDKIICKRLVNEVKKTGKAKNKTEILNLIIRESVK